MHKTLFLALALSVTNVALACGGKECAHCGEETTTAAVDISKAPGTHAAFDVKGMKCGKCSAKLTAALQAVDGVNAVAVDHTTGKAEVAFDAAKTNADALKATVTALQFEIADAPKG